MDRSRIGQRGKTQAISSKFYGLKDDEDKLMVLEYDGRSVNIMPDEEQMEEVAISSMPGNICRRRQLLESYGELFRVDIIYIQQKQDKIP